MGIITSEAMYPSGTGYTTFSSEISDLGATRPPNSIIYQPSATIFNMAMLLAGLLTLTATFFQHKYFKELLFSIPLGLFGWGLVGIGIFPGDKAPYHGMFAMLIFSIGGLAAILAFKIVSSPFKYVGILFGSISLATWAAVLFIPNIIFSLIGMGGTERWLVYPLVLWLTGLGGYLMNTPTTQSK